jgi:hypothetical protein
VQPHAASMKATSCQRLSEFLSSYAYYRPLVDFNMRLPYKGIAHVWPGMIVVLRRRQFLTAFYKRHLEGDSGRSVRVIALENKSCKVEKPKDDSPCAEPKESMEI